MVDSVGFCVKSQILVSWETKAVSSGKTHSPLPWGSREWSSWEAGSLAKNPENPTTAARWVASARDS